MTGDWLIWQLADSGFPTGSFAHSFGLEAAWQQGEVDSTSLELFIRDIVTQQGHGALPFVATAYMDPQSIGEVDDRCEAFLRNAVANRASRVQGRAWLTTIERTFTEGAVVEACRCVRANAQHRHFAPIFGATLRALDVSLEGVTHLFMFGVCRGTVAAAVRLGLVGPTDGQRLLAEAEPHVSSTIDRCSRLTIDDAAQTAPLIDLWQAAHERLYSRIFQS